jgi:hypothetical protein
MEDLRAVDLTGGFSPAALQRRIYSKTREDPAKPDIVPAGRLFELASVGRAGIARFSSQG